ncbi:MAG: YCF48-related protein, partial [Phycisphaerales bacterium]
MTASSTASAQEAWVRQSPLPYQPLDAESVTFASPTHGYIAGSDIVMDLATSSDDFLMETHDGGLTWTQLDFPGSQQNFRDVFFVDELHGWVVGNSTVAVNDNFRTVDGGLSWQQIQLPAGTWTTVHFLDPNFGWAKSLGGPPALSTDGGLTWTFPIVVVDGNAQLLATVRFANLQLGIAMTGSGIFRTTDGGVNWTQVLSGDFYTPKFLSESVLLVPVFPTGMLQSTDGGLSWNPVTTPGSGYFSVEAFSADIAIAMKTNGEVIRTT